MKAMAPIASNVVVACLVSFIPTIFGQDLDDVVKNSIPQPARLMCEIDPSKYHTVTLTSALCAKQAKWKAVQDHPVWGPETDCTVDKQTGKMRCNRKRQCGTGLTGNFSEKLTTTTITYDCTDSCSKSGALLFACCNKCQSTQQELEGQPHVMGEYNGHFVDKVVCNGCSNQLDSARPNHEECVTTTGGKIVCRSSEQCSLGEPTQVTTPTRYSCQVEDCSTECFAKDAQLKATCCTQCLSSLCGKPANKYACLGCENIPTIGSIGDALISTTTPTPTVPPHQPTWLIVTVIVVLVVGIGGMCLVCHKHGRDQDNLAYARSLGGDSPYSLLTSGDAEEAATSVE